MPTKLRVVLGFALAFVLITLFEVVTQREDWPFSCYPMYSKLAPKVAKRGQLVGVSAEGEFPLTEDQTSPYKGARLISIARRLAEQPDHGREFLRVLGARYEKKREQEGWPLLEGVRAYAETWPVRTRLEGMDKPKRVLETALYVPPAPLLDRLKAETAGTATPLGAVSVPQGDRIVDLDITSCGDGCSSDADTLATNGSAMSLKGAGTRASVSTRLALERGSYAVLVRMRVPTTASLERLFLELDGKRVGETNGLGNYLEALPYTGWVWASRGPGLTALVLDIPTTGEHLLALSTLSRVIVDQLWLRRSARELPVDNAPRRP